MKYRLRASWLIIQFNHKILLRKVHISLNNIEYVRNYKAKKSVCIMRRLSTENPCEIVECPEELGDIIKTLIFHKILLLLWLSIYRTMHTQAGD